MKRFLWLGLVVVLFLICTGCGDTFRPVIIPNPPAFPDPRASHTVMAVNDNGPDRGSNMVVDVSGDTDVGVADMGISPVHAVQQTASQVLVVNHGAPGMNADSLTKITFSGVQIGNTTTISLPPDSAPNFVATTESNQAYVSLPGIVPDPSNFPNDNAVGVVSTSNNSLGPIIRVGNNPIAIVETPDKNKLYVANKGDGTVSNFNTLDRSPRNPAPLALSSPPIWMAARSDSQRVYALETNGTLAMLDTTSSGGPDILTETSISVPGALSMLYDGHLNRLYIPGGSQLAIVDVAPSTPQLLKSIPIPQVPSVPPVAAFAVAVAALPDGSRAYVASVPNSAQPSQVSISGVMGDGKTATYTYTLTGGHDLTVGLPIAVSGITPDGFNGTFTITTVTGTSCDLPTQVCTFQAPNTTVAAQTAETGTGASTIDHLFPQVTVINTSGNTVKSTFAIPGFPDATVVGSPYFVPVCVPPTRFRFNMAAGGDSSRVYLATCDAGNVNIIRTSDDSYLLNLPAPASSRAPIPPSTQPPPQNPVFLIAGP